MVARPEPPAHRRIATTAPNWHRKRTIRMRSFFALQHQARTLRNAVAFTGTNSGFAAVGPHAPRCAVDFTTLSTHVGLPAGVAFESGRPQLTGSGPGGRAISTSTGTKLFSPFSREAAQAYHVGLTSPRRMTSYSEACGLQGPGRPVQHHWPILNSVPPLGWLPIIAKAFRYCRLAGRTTGRLQVSSSKSAEQLRPKASPAVDQISWAHPRSLSFAHAGPAADIA